MAWFDHETEFYREPIGPLRQGDLVLAPSAVMEPGIGGMSGVPPIDLGDERLVQVWTAGRDALPETPTLRVRTRWDLAMVLPHDCALEKEFNERVGELIAIGHPEDEAIAIASSDPTLDRLIAIAPARSYEEALPRRWEGIRTGQRHGTFPLPKNEAALIEPGWVDLTAPTTIDRSLLSSGMRIASLSARSIDYLRAALALYWSYRDLTRADEISRAIGRTIVDIKAAPMPKEKLRLELFLDGDSGTLTLEGSNKPVPPNHGR
jgi:hypothetical protein